MKMSWNRQVGRGGNVLFSHFCSNLLLFPKSILQRLFNPAMTWLAVSMGICSTLSWLLRQQQPQLSKALTQALEKHLLRTSHQPLAFCTLLKPACLASHEMTAAECPWTVLMFRKGCPTHRAWEVWKLGLRTPQNPSQLSLWAQVAKWQRRNRLKLSPLRSWVMLMGKANALKGTWATDLGQS